MALTKEELKALNQYRKGFVTEVECALSIGLDRNVLNRVMIFGSGSPESVNKIKVAIKELLEEAASTTTK